MSELDAVKRIGQQPAFPTAVNRINNESGMTLRQYAAIAAMQGILSDPRAPDDETKVASIAIACADALLAELAK